MGNNFSAILLYLQLQFYLSFFGGGGYGDFATV